MKRRLFITLLGGAAALAPFAARAQQAAIPVIGLLGGPTAVGWAPFVAAFRQGLSEAGYDEGRNVAIEYRWAEGQYDRLPGLAAELVQRRVAAIAALTTPAALAAKAATATIPIVFTTIADPVQIGLVPSLSHPGGHVTGVTSLNVEVGQKLLELMHEAVPAATTVALLVNPANPNAAKQSSDLQAAARTLGLKLHVLQAGSVREIDSAFATLVQERAGGLVIVPDAFFNTRSGQIAALALRHGLPSIFAARGFAAVGGLLSYAGNAADSYRQAGLYTGRILKGDKPADLPVMRSAKVELSVNLNTAKALGLSLPLSLLGRADEVIE